MRVFSKSGTNTVVSPSGGSSGSGTTTKAGAGTGTGSGPKPTGGAGTKTGPVIGLALSFTLVALFSHLG